MAKKVSKRIIYNPSLGKVVARGAKRSRSGRFHVISSISDLGKWTLVSEGSIRPLRVFSTKNAAISFAKRSSLGRRDMREVIVHGQDGSIQNKISFQVQD